MTRDNEPWLLVEVKSSARRNLSPSLAYFGGQIRPAHAFQVAFDQEPVDEDLFTCCEPIRVPATTFLSQMV